MFEGLNRTIGARRFWLLLPCAALLVATHLLGLLLIQRSSSTSLESPVFYDQCVAEFGPFKPSSSPRQPPVPAKSTERPKVAVCMNGIVRTLTTDVVANNIAENLLKPLDADLFMFVNPTQKGDVNDKSMAALPNAEFKVITLEQVLEKLNPVAIEYYSEVIEPEYSRAPCFNRQYAGSVTIWKWWPQFWGMRQCYRMMLEAEQEKGIKYDFVIRARPDVAYKTKIELPVPMKDLHKYPRHVFGQHFKHRCMMCDHFYVVPREVSDTFFAVEQAFRNCHLTKSTAGACHCHRPEWDLPGGWSNHSECTISRYSRDHDIVLNNDFEFLFERIRWPDDSKEYKAGEKLSRLPCPWGE